MDLIETQYIVLAISFIIPFITIFLITPRFIIRAKEKGVVVRDVYKKGTVYVPTRGGLVILMAIFFTVAILAAFHIRNAWQEPTEFWIVFYAESFIIAIYAAMGIIDDYINIGRIAKILVPFFLSFLHLSLITKVSTTVHLPVIGSIDLQRFYIYGVMPMYVLVTANLVNMHSGFNGLQSGMSSMILIFMLVKSILISNVSNMYVIAAVTGAIIAFWWFNKYPAKILEGNIGSLSVGAAIGIAIVVQGFIVSGFIMLIPHTVNFLMYAYWRVMNKLHPGDEKYKIKKYGWINGKGYVRGTNNYTLKWLLPNRYDMTEKEAVYAMYLLTFVFCLIGLFIPY